MTARKINTGISAGLQAQPVSDRQVDDAFEAFSALHVMAAASPSLRSNSYFTALIDTARARFFAIYEAL